MVRIKKLVLDLKDSLLPSHLPPWLFLPHRENLLLRFPLHSVELKVLGDSIKLIEHSYQISGKYILFSFRVYGFQRPSHKPLPSPQTLQVPRPPPQRKRQPTRHRRTIGGLFPGYTPLGSPR